MTSIGRDLSHPLRIRNCQPEDIGYMACLHAAVYIKEYGLDPIFEKTTLPGLLDFLESKRAGNIWVAESGNRIVGFIGIIGRDSETAQLRWFLVDPEFRGMGLGKKLMETGLAYCRDLKYQKVFLWTVKDLDAARHLYEKFDFSITETKEHFLWEKNIVEERWDLVLS